jgi:hypothetical protein
VAGGYNSRDGKVANRRKFFSQSFSRIKRFVGKPNSADMTGKAEGCIDGDEKRIVILVPDEGQGIFQIQGVDRMFQCAE